MQGDGKKKSKREECPKKFTHAGPRNWYGGVTRKIASLLYIIVQKKQVSA